MHNAAHNVVARICGKRCDVVTTRVLCEPYILAEGGAVLSLKLRKYSQDKDISCSVTQLAYFCYTSIYWHILEFSHTTDKNR